MFPLALHSGLGSAGWFFHPARCLLGWSFPKSIFTQVSRASAEVAGTGGWPEHLWLHVIPAAGALHRATQGFRRPRPKRTDPGTQMFVKAVCPEHLLPSQWPKQVTCPVPEFTCEEEGWQSAETTDAQTHHSQEKPCMQQSVNCHGSPRMKRSFQLGRRREGSQSLIHLTSISPECRCWGFGMDTTAELLLLRAIIVHVQIRQFQMMTSTIRKTKLPNRAESQ